MIEIIKDYQRKYLGKNNKVYKQYINSTSSIQQNSIGNYAEKHSLRPRVVSW